MATSIVWPCVILPEEQQADEIQVPARFVKWVFSERLISR
jgi:hypothetical protein